LSLLDSPLNKAGFLEVYLTTNCNQVIKINSLTKIPRTYKRFAPLMVQLLKRMTIRADENNQILMKVISSPVSTHLPPESLKIALSTKGQLININDKIQEINPEGSIVFLVGGVARGNPTMEVDYF
jgi:rRNA small subunit pseudouridine methyltransferase Nep1